ncbi:MAG: histidine kinase [Anaerolineae bacterium]|nr:histidine kinase [Anaerolineae bacterium]
MTASHDEQNQQLRIRLIAVLAAVIFMVFLVVTAFVVAQQPNMGFQLNVSTGMILQVFITHPDGDQLTIQDRVLAINGIPVTDYTSEELRSLSGTAFVEIVSPDKSNRVITMRLLPNNFWMFLEVMSLPLIGLLLFIPGFLLIFAKSPTTSALLFLLFGFFFGLFLVVGQPIRMGFEPFGLAYYLSMIFASWCFILFHWDYLTVKPAKWIKYAFHFIHAGILLFFVLIWLFFRTDPDMPGILDLVLTGYLLFSFPIVILSFAVQPIRQEFSFGTVRTLFLTTMVGALPCILFFILPILLNSPASLPLIILVLPFIIIPANYFILMINRKRWLDATLVILSFTTAIFLEQALVILGNRFLPGGLPDYRVTSNWFDYAISVAVLGIFLALYFGIYALFNRLIYGNVVTTSRKLYQAGFSTDRKNSGERPVVQMARLFIREFFRFEYLSVCLIDGTVMQFDAERHLQVLQFDENRMKQLIKELGGEKADRSASHRIDRSVNAMKLALVENRFSQIFGENPRHCYLLFGTTEPIGFIVTGERRHNEPFDLRENQQLALLLSQFEVMMENLLLVERIDHTNRQLRLSGQQMLQMRENERRRIARDMHDNIIQAITAFRYQLNELYDSEQMMISDEEADALQHSLSNITNDIRDICFNLRPPALDATGLQSAVVSLVESYYSRDSLFIEFNVEGDKIINAITEDVAICLYRVLQESLLNITKHARTRKARVDLHADESQILLEVVDEGQGFEVPGQINELVSDGHFGLMGAQEFLETVNGTFLVESNPGKGATIKAVVPLIREVGENGVFYDYRR